MYSILHSLVFCSVFVLPYITFLTDVITWAGPVAQHIIGSSLESPQFCGGANSEIIELYTCSSYKVRNCRKIETRDDLAYFFFFLDNFDWFIKCHPSTYHLGLIIIEPIAGFPWTCLHKAVIDLKTQSLHAHSWVCVWKTYIPCMLIFHQMDSGNFFIMLWHL